jgi:two-component system phosphate regulon sensor histidine kinase PhoR
MNRLTEDLLALAGSRARTTSSFDAAHPGFSAGGRRDRVAGGDGGRFGVTLESGGAPADVVLADPDAMTQVFGNLIENAMKYGKSGADPRLCAGARMKSNLWCRTSAGASLMSI